MSLDQRTSRSTGRIVGIASVIWATSIFLSRLLGLVREQIVGRTLGATREADLYFASFTLPDFLNYLLAAGALSIVFIPIFIEHLRENGSERAWQAFSATANFIAVASIIGIAVLSFFAGPLAEVVAPGFTPAEMDQLVRLIRIVLPAQFFLIVGGLMSAALQSHDRHLLPAMAPLVYSLGIIVGGLVGAPLGWGAEGFAWGVLAGAAGGPFLLPLIGCLRLKMTWQPIFAPTNPDLIRYLKLSLPIMIGFSIVAVDEWITKNQASYLAAGTLSYLQYARTLMKVPMGIFGMAAGVASYPTITRMVTAGNIVEAYAVLARAVRITLLLTFAAQVVVTLCGFEFAYLIWGYLSHRFVETDAQNVAAVLGLLCLGLAGWSAQTLVSRGFYALGNTWLPTFVGTAVAFCAVPIYIVLRQHFGAEGLAVASAIAILIYVFLLGGLQYRRFVREAAKHGGTLAGTPGILDAAVRLAIATAIAIALGLVVRPVLLDHLPGMAIVPLLARTALLSLLGLTVYVAAARLLGVRELSEALQLLLRRKRASAQ
ncbi:murein biosynthesis integral membrane protein MurJ [Microbacteriaceae bacterium K1510]|nr:murein biosynthesis integral membrane protein MurJ [Microbacteriaceae bacterium K1510]